MDSPPVTRVAHSNRATKVPALLTTSGGFGDRIFTFNQKQSSAQGSFHGFGRHKLAGRASLTISSRETDWHVIIDVVRFVPVTR